MLALLKTWPFAALKNVYILPYFRLTWARPTLAPLKHFQTIICFLHAFDFGVTFFIMVVSFPDSSLVVSSEKLRDGTG